MMVGAREGEAVWAEAGKSDAIYEAPIRSVDTRAVFMSREYTGIGRVCFAGWWLKFLPSSEAEFSGKGSFDCGFVRMADETFAQDDNAELGTEY